MGFRHMYTPVGQRPDYRRSRPAIRLVYLTNNDWPGQDPGLPFSVFNARGFWQAGVDCWLLLHGRTAAPVSVVRKVLFDLDEDVPIVPLRAPRLGGSKSLFYLRAFLTLLRSDRTVLITRNLNFLPWAVALKKLRGMRVYFEAHNFWTDPGLRQERLRATQWRQVRLERTWLPSVDGLLCISEPLTRLYRQYYPQLSVLTMLPGTTRVRAPQRLEFSYTLGYIGGFDTSRYPLGIVMQALARIRTLNVRLLCIGAKNSTDRVRVQDEARRLGVAERVTVHPWVTGEALEQLKSQIDVGVAVLTDTFHPRIGCPVKLLEYLAMSTPFVATRLESTTTLVDNGEQGVLVDNTPEAWAQAICSLYADFSRYQRMAQSCYALAMTMEWEHRARRILHTLEAQGTEA